MGRLFLQVVALWAATSGTISGVAAISKDVFAWFVDTKFAGEDCNNVCYKKFQGYCDGSAAWPDSEPELRAIAEKYNIPCDSFCRRTDIGSAPTFMPPGERYACSSSNEIATKPQCIFGNGQGVRPRCQRRFRPPGGLPRIQICPCRYATTPTSTTTITTTSTTVSTSTNQNSYTTTATITSVTTPFTTTASPPTTTATPAAAVSSTATTTSTTLTTIATSNPTTTTTTTTSTSTTQPTLDINFLPAQTTEALNNRELVVVVVTIAGSVLTVFLIGVVVFLVVCHRLVTQRRNANANPGAGGNNPAGPGVNHPPNHRPNYNPNQGPHGHGPYSRHLSPGSTIGSEYSTNRSVQRYDSGSGIELRSNFSGDNPSVGSFGSSVHHTISNNYTVVRRDGSVYSDPVYPDEAPTTDENYDN